ncbi:penicillin amidase superfamily [alpha proteobacterium U9-1i]|nr:penicillin amidase superfamily [alpha proteobacterium U9-1i]
MRHWFGLVLGLALASCATAPPPSRDVEVRWDQWGVPHVRAADDVGAAYGLGWAQARARPNLVLKLMGQARGRGGEYWGEAYRATDELLWRLGVPQSLPALYAAQAPAQQRQLDAFAAGINAYAAAHPELIDDEMERALPVTALDVLGHIERAIHITFVMGGELGRVDGVLATEHEGVPGSNAWAVAPSRAAGGHAMLLANPHLRWDDLYLFFEAHMRADDLDVYGVALIGQPFLILGFNDSAGWTHTVNTYDGVDTFRFAKSGAGYVVDGAVRPFETETAMLHVRNAEGGDELRPLDIRRTIAGPVLRETPTHVYAVRVAGLGDPARARITEQYWRMARARNADAFEAAMAMQQQPMLNTVYADRAGDVFYLFNALAPRRSSGDAAAWAGITEGGAANVWTDYLPYEQLPHYRNPPSGFIQNANEPPWTSTVPAVLNPRDYAGDLVPPRLPPRPHSSLSLLSGDDSISFDEFTSYTLSSRLMSADYVLDDLLAGAAASRDRAVREAGDVLRAWDRQTRAASRGAVLYQEWAFQFGLDDADYRTPWSFNAPLTGPSGLNDVPNAVAALKRAADVVRQRYGRLDVAWGEAERMRYRGADLPSDLGPGPLGAFHVGWWTRDPTGVDRFTGGTTYVAAIEFAERVRARGILAYGNFEGATPPGVVDQLPMLSRNEFRAMNFHAADVEAATVERELLTMR